MFRGSFYAGNLMLKGISFFFPKFFCSSLYVKQKRRFKQHLRKSLTITVWLTRVEQILCCNMGESINYVVSLLPRPPSFTSLLHKLMLNC